MTMPASAGVVDDAVVGEHRLEEHRIGDERGDAGQEDRRAEEAAAPELGVVQRHRKEQRQDDHDRHLHDEEDQGVAERAQEHRVLRQALMLAKPPKLKFMPRPVWKLIQSDQTIG